nr:hypothetical protein [Ferrimicrobium acidiphilum]
MADSAKERGVDCYVPLHMVSAAVVGSQEIAPSVCEDLERLALRPRPLLTRGPRPASTDQRAVAPVHLEPVPFVLRISGDVQYESDWGILHENNVLALRAVKYSLQADR